MIPIAKPNLKGNELKYVTDCINTGWISSQGKYVKMFEEEFAKYCGTKYSTSTTSCTTALHLALLAIGIKADDEVIVPNLTFATTSNVVKFCGAKEVLVDVDKETYNIDPKLIEKKITSKTKAIIIVHLYGFPCNMDEIMSLAKKHGLYVIEDAAEAHGAEYNGKKIGSMGDIGCFSFFGNKIMTTGEGGIAVSNNKELMDKMIHLKNHGIVQGKGYWHDVVGYNYRLTNIQAAIGLAQLEQLEDFITKRNEIAEIYKNELSDVRGIKFQNTCDNANPVYWMFSIEIDENYPLSIEELVEYLKNNGVDTRRMFNPLNKMPPYKDDGDFPISEYLYLNTLVLPTYVSITKDELIKIGVLIKNAKK